MGTDRSDEPAVVSCVKCHRPEGRPVDPDFICRKCRHAADEADALWGRMGRMPGERYEDYKERSRSDV